MLRIILSILLLQLVLGMRPAQAQAPAPLFADSSLLSLRLTFDVEALLNDRGQDREYHWGKLVYKDENGKNQRISVQLRVRGNFRRDPNNCDFPPIHIKFPEKQPEGSPFAGQKKLKLVTHCQEEDLVMKEYLVYRTYQLFTPQSFKVRAAKITYRDSRNEHEVERKFSFFIESPKALAARLNGSDVFEDGLPEEGIDSTAVLRMHMFAGIVGNMDWWIAKGKNVKFVQYPSGPAVPVPYDFDFCHLVDAPYTHLDHDVVEANRFRPLCMPADSYTQIRDQFLSKKLLLYHMLNSTTELKKSVVKECITYLDQLFLRLETDWDQILARYQATCTMNINSPSGQ